MSIFLPSLDSYSFIDPELFVDEDPKKTGVERREKKKRKSERSKKVLKAIAENVPPSLERAWKQSDGHGKDHETDNSPNYQSLEIDGTRGDKLAPISQKKWSRLREVVKHKEKVRLGDVRRHLRNSRGMFYVVANATSRTGRKAGVLNEFARVRFTPQEIRAKFVKNVRLVINVSKVLSVVLQLARQQGLPQTFQAIADEATGRIMSAKEMTFDPSVYKAKKEISISNEVKHILRLPSDLRSAEQVQTAMFGLQSLPSFAEYPLHMQEKLAKVAWYEVIPPKRMIIRQGHYAENFYFILSGQAVATILARDHKTGQSFMRTASIMRKGSSFGELALLHHSQRTATVTTQDTVQLLTIGREDFFEIFMSGTGPDSIPDHIKYISQCEFMKDWPIAQLLARPDQCLIHFFKRNVVIVENSCDTDWLYVVKSGSCQVIKSLRRVTARLGIKTKDVKCENRPRNQSIIKLSEPHAKVDTGLSRRKHFLPTLSQVRTPPSEDPDSLASASRDDIMSKMSSSGSTQETFSKDMYMHKLNKKKAYFSSTESLVGGNSSFPSLCSLDHVPSTLEASHNGCKLPPIFVQVETLDPKDVFGLSTVEFDEDSDRQYTVVSLVSKGAECIMLSKEFFMKHANDMVKSRLRKLMRPYPSDETFQENLQIKEDWELYKKLMIEDLTKRR